MGIINPEKRGEPLSNSLGQATQLYSVDINKKPQGTDLEEILIRDIKSGKPVQLDMALLIISGLKTEKEIAGYIEVLDNMQTDFHYYAEKVLPKMLDGEYSQGDVRKAKFLFEYLWLTADKKIRGSMKDTEKDFFLKDVIESQISHDKNQPVGNCLGLTALYTVLGLREGLNLSVVEGSCKEGRHTISKLRDSAREYFIDNTNYRAFDYPLDFKVEFDSEPLKALVSMTISGRACEKVRKQDYNGAIQDHTKVIEISPERYEQYLLRGLAESAVGYSSGAMNDYLKAIEVSSKALETNPRNAYAYLARAKSCLFVGQNSSKRQAENAKRMLNYAEKDLKTAVKIDKNLNTPNNYDILVSIRKALSGR